MALLPRPFSTCFLILSTVSMLCQAMVTASKDAHFYNVGNVNTNADTSIKDTLLPHQIAIVSVIDGPVEYMYKQSIETVKCYSWHHNYTYVMLNTQELPEFTYNCNQPEFFFRRHCIIANYAQRYKKEIKYIVIIDSDIMVINPVHRVENYLPKGEEDILFYDRSHNSEIMAGSYIIKNTLYTRSFLKFFADYQYKKPIDNTFGDNAALHPVFAEFIGVVEHHNKYLRCMEIYRSHNSGLEPYMLFVSCMRYVLNLMDETPNDINYYTYEGGKIKIVRKLSKKRWSRDSWLSDYKFCDDELFHHGLKEKEIELRKNLFKRKFLSNEKMCKSSDFLKLWDYDESFRMDCKFIDYKVKVEVDRAHDKHMNYINESNVTRIEG
uniref:Nucleotide-diphospho-sugar transferase domain-containing protein n=1 Tax=Strongyloides venezuelensis TaxID=75913 RepID=A0A0K0EZ07_STRVS